MEVSAGALNKQNRGVWGRALQQRELHAKAVKQEFVSLRARMVREQGAGTVTGFYLQKFSGRGMA